MIQPSLRSTIDNNQRPQWVRWLNWTDRRLQQIGISPIILSEDSLIENAQKKAQLSDWGNSSFRFGLKTLLTSLKQEANLSLTGRWLMQTYLTDLLVNRLQIQSTLTQHSDILDVPIQRPLIITGLPRTGTTFLHRVLALDSQFRWLRLWELLHPCPPPTPAHAATDPRIQNTQALVQKYKNIAPNLSTAHLIEAQLPEEGNQLLEHAFTSFLFSLRAHVPTYESWLRAQDMQASYQYYRQQLQLLSWQWPGRWLLKAPCHLRNLEALLSVFPDACIVHTHRDPCAVVPSICSLTAMFRSIFTDELDLATVGKDLLDITAYAHKQSRQFRQNHPTLTICDIDYAELIQAPLKTIQHIYNFFGDRLHYKTAGKMEQWITANPQSKHGIHKYSAEQFGLSKAIIQRKFDTAF